MRKRNWNRRFGIQRLEDRRLLAADVAVDLALVDVAEPEVCDISEMQSVDESETESQVEELDLESTEIDINMGVETNVDIEASDDGVHDLGDPVDGTDGFFGSIDAENPSQPFSFSPSEEGVIDIVVASSFGDSETRLEVTDGNGDLVISTSVEDLDGFKQVSFESEAGENYLLTVSSEEGTEGHFQVTVGHSETPEPVDQHVDTIGESSTELTLTDSAATLDGELETAGDVDTFRFTADADGEALLALAELDADNATELSVQVFDSLGDQVSRGITNESLGISFDVEAGSEYYISVGAAEGETGSYRIDLSVEVSASESETDVDVEDDITNDIDDAVVTEDSEVDDSADDVDVVDSTDDFVVVDSTDDFVVVDSTDDFVVVDSTDDFVVVDSNDETTPTETTEVVSDGLTTEEEAELVDATDGEDTTLTEDTTLVEESASGDEVVSNEEATSETETELQAEPAATEETETNDSELVNDCPPIPVDVVDAETSEAASGSSEEASLTEIPVDVIEIAESVTEDITNDLPESFELVEDETDDDALAAAVTEISAAVDDLVNTVLDATDHLDSVDDLISEELGLCFVDAVDAEQAIDSFFADGDLVDELVGL